jgi:hypothetical protein
MMIYKEATSSSLDPGRHLASLDMTRLLPLHLPRVTSDAASCIRVSGCGSSVQRTNGMQCKRHGVHARLGLCMQPPTGKGGRAEYK